MKRCQWCAQPLAWWQWHMCRRCAVAAFASDPVPCPQGVRAGFPRDRWSWR